MGKDAFIDGHARLGGLFGDILASKSLGTSTDAIWSYDSIIKSAEKTVSTFVKTPHSARY